MNQTRRFVRGVVVAVFGFGSAAASADGNVYIGGSLGAAKVDLSAGEFATALTNAGRTGVVATVDNTDTGWKLFGGFKFSQNLGVEVGYVNLGTVDFFATYVTPPGSPYQGKSELDGFVFDLVASVPLNDTLTVFGKVGAFKWKVNARITDNLTVTSLEDDGYDWTFGLGASMKIAERLALRAEWERFSELGKTTKRNYDLLSAGLTYSF